MEHVSDIAALDKGDAIKMGEQIGAATVDLEWVQVSHWCASHPIPSTAGKMSKLRIYLN